MRTRSAILGAALLASLGFAAASAGRPDASGLAGPQRAASAPQQPAAVSMVVYKSPT